MLYLFLSFQHPSCSTGKPKQSPKISAEFKGGSASNVLYGQHVKNKGVASDSVF